MSEQRTLTDVQMRALRWLRDFDHNQSGWDKKWTAITQTGPMGRIVIDAGDWDAIKGLIEPEPFEIRKRIWRLTDAGHAALEHAAGGGRG